MENQTHTGAALLQPRLVRLCRFCAQKLDLWMEWKNNHCLYDHATSKACDECNGQNLRNPKSVFTVKFRLPNAGHLAPPTQDSNEANLR